MRSIRNCSTLTRINMRNLQLPPGIELGSSMMPFAGVNYLTNTAKLVIPQLPYKYLERCLAALILRLYAQ